MLSKLFTIYIKYIFIAMCIGFIFVGISNYTTNATENTSKNQSRFLVIQDDHGIRVIFNDSEFYFNATNGGEITEYYDLSIDPLKTRNLANISLGGDFQNLWPLFASGIYNPYADFLPKPDYATGGDTNADVRLIEKTNDRIVIFTSSKLVNLDGFIANDSEGLPVHINTTWTFNKNTGFIYVDRTWSIPNTLNLPRKWRLYSFYMTRTTGFEYNGTFYLFNTTYVNTTIVNRETYKNCYKCYSIFPNDPKDVFGIAAPFSNTSIGGDGAHNIIVTYYNKLVDIDEWKCDCFNVGKIYNFTEWGPAHESLTPINITTHTYHAVVHFTHNPINEQNVIKYAKYVDSIYPLFEVNVTADNNRYHPGDKYTISASGTSYHNLSNLSLKFTASDENGIYFEKEYLPHDFTKGETFSRVLFSGTIPINEPLGNRTFTVQIVSSTGAIIASDSTTISII
ncbi:MAG: hypothetical protein ACE5KT_01225 [Methanosarcinales archaeon]